MSFLNLQNTPYRELATVRLRVIDEDLLPPLIRGRAWCAINLTGHGAKIFVKPIVYLVASIAQLGFSFYECWKGNSSVDDLKQSGRFLACAILSPFSEAANVCKSAMGIIFPHLYYRSSVVALVDATYVSKGERNLDYQSSAVALVDATYASNGEGNLDYSYVNPRLRFGFVIDGAGHGNPQRKKIQDPIIREFIESYAKSLEASDFNTSEGALEFVQKQMNAFGKKINQVLPDHAPAIMFTQIIKIGNKRHLLIAHMSDTALYIKTREGWWTVPPQPDLGFGSNGIRQGEIHIPVVKFLALSSEKPHELSPGDELVGFTDGIGEFLTKSECCAILEANNDRGTLLEQFKQKIIEKGNVHASEGKRGGAESGKAANGGRTIKFHNPDPRQTQDHDDISLFSLVVE